MRNLTLYIGLCLSSARIWLFILICRHQTAGITLRTSCSCDVCRHAQLVVVSFILTIHTSAWRFPGRTHHETYIRTVLQGWKDRNTHPVLVEERLVYVVYDIQQWVAHAKQSAFVSCHILSALPLGVVKTGVKLQWKCENSGRPAWNKIFRQKMTWSHSHAIRIARKTGRVVCCTARQDVRYVYDTLIVQEPGLRKTVQESKMNPVLYERATSSCSFRIRIALNLADVEYEHSFVSATAGREAKFQSLNPQGLVPLLVFGHTRLSQVLTWSWYYILLWRFANHLL